MVRPLFNVGNTQPGIHRTPLSNCRNSRLVGEMTTRSLIKDVLVQKIALLI